MDIGSQLGMKRATVVKLILLAGVSFLLGFMYNYHLPKFESFLLVQMEKLTREHTPIRVWAQRLRFHLLPIGVVLEDVKILPQAPLDKYLAPAKLKEVGARLAFWPLLRGEIRLSQVYIRDSELNVFIKEDLAAGAAGRKGPSQVKIDFEQIYGLPIDEILLESVQIQGRLDPQNVVFRISDLSLLIENRYQSLFVEMTAPRVLVKPGGAAEPLNAQVELRTLVEAQEMQVSAFKLKAGDSFVVASGRFNGDFSAGKLDNGALDARTKLHLSDLNVWEKVFFLKPKIPTLAGHAELEFGMEVRNGKGYKFDAQFNTREVQIDKFIVGQAQGHLTSDLKTVTSDLIRLENKSGKAEIERLRMTLEPKVQFSANVKSPGLEVKQLLENLDVKHVPILIPVKGDASCQGVLQDAPEITCQARITTPKVHVDSGRPSFSTIVEVEDARAKGSVKITSKQVEYKADIEVGKNSSGRSDGVINYDTGFKINYQGDRLEFADVKNLANLKFEGGMKVKGGTQGTSDWATIDMNVDGKDIWLEDYPFGQATARLGYKRGHLKFDNIAGQYQVSRYTGLVDLDLDKDRIRLSGQIPFMDLKDVQGLFTRKVTLPFQASGTGTGHVEAEGPFRFQDMSYEFRSTFYRGQLAKESFDELVFQVKSVNGLVQSQKITLRKANGVAEVKGQITPKGEIDTVVVGRGMRLEQSENVLNMGFDIQGIADFTVLVRGQLPRPRVEVNGRLSKVVLGDQAAEDSVFKLNFLSDRVEGSGQFLGTKLISDFTFPYTQEAPFVFKLKTRKWDFIPTFSLISKSARQLDFATSVTMDVSLQAAQGGFWASSGQAKVSEFTIRKGAKSLVAERPMILNFRQGSVNSENFNLTSGDSYLKLDVAGLNRNALNASLNGKLDLSLLGLFTPFITDLRGNMALSMDLKGSAAKPLLSGSAYVDKGYVKFADFPHPFSGIRADLLFNDNQILINALRAEMAGGRVSGEGKVSFTGGARPIDVRGSFNEVKVNVPDGFKSQGSGTVAIRGERFPYVMDITYGVTGGEIVREFTNSDSGSVSVRASSYLPRFLDEEAFHPFTFLVDVNLKSPIAVNNALVQASATGQIKASGTPDHLLLNGSITPLPGGKFFFRETPFEIGSGFVEYTNNPPSDPKIYATGTSRVTENVVDELGRTTTNQYDVSVLVQGHAQDLQFTFSSQPPLGQREIVSLLAFGTTGGSTSTAEDRRNAELQTANTGAVLGSAVLGAGGAKRFKEALGLDVRVSTQQVTTFTQSGVADPTALPKITLSRQWTPKLNASASSTLESNPNNNVKLEYKLNKSTSVVGSWDGRETLYDQRKDVPNILGLDLQFKVPFK
jgi:translocation and assembly module TamB